jgi:hypothetical protein
MFRYMTTTRSVEFATAYAPNWREVLRFPPSASVAFDVHDLHAFKTGTGGTVAGAAADMAAPVAR